MSRSLSVRSRVAVEEICNGVALVLEPSLRGLAPLGRRLTRAVSLMDSDASLGAPERLTVAAPLMLANRAPPA